MEEIKIGDVIRYIPGLKVATVRLRQKISVGDILHFRGRSTDFEQKLKSMELDKLPVQDARPSQQVGMLSDMPVRENDEVMKVIE